MNQLCTSTAYLLAVLAMTQHGTKQLNSMDWDMGRLKSQFILMTKKTTYGFTQYFIVVSSHADGFGFIC